MIESLVSSVWVPDWLYLIWPYLVLGITVGYLSIGYYPVSIITGGYAAWLFAARR